MRFNRVPAWALALLWLGIPSEWLGGSAGEVDRLSDVQTLETYQDDETESESTLRLNDHTSIASDYETEMSRMVVPANTAEGPPMPAWRRNLERMERHRALLLAMVLSAALVARGVNLAVYGLKPQDVQKAREALQAREENLEQRRTELEVKKKELASLQQRTALAEGAIQRRQQEMESKAMAYTTEDQLLEEKKAQLSLLRSEMEIMEDRVKGEGRDMSELDEQGDHKAMGAGAEVFRRVEAELAVFDLAASSVPREKGRNTLLREYNDIVKMNSALAVLDKLRKEPTSLEQAEDILRARRLVSGAVVRIQKTTHAAIQRLQEVKEDLQVEQRIATEDDWTAKPGDQRPSDKKLEKLTAKLEECRRRQKELNEKMAKGSSESLAYEILKWENYEVSLRAQQVQLMSTYAPPTPSDAQSQDRQMRIERAKDGAAELRRRLPDAALRMAFVESLITKITEEIDELQELFRLVTRVGERCKAPHPEAGLALDYDERPVFATPADYDAARRSMLLGSSDDEETWASEVSFTDTTLGSASETSFYIGSPTESGEYWQPFQSPLDLSRAQQDVKGLRPPHRSAEESQLGFVPRQSSFVHMSIGDDEGDEDVEQPAKRKRMSVSPVPTTGGAPETSVAEDAEVFSSIAPEEVPLPVDDIAAFPVAAGAAGLGAASAPQDGPRPFRRNDMQRPPFPEEHIYDVVLSPPVQRLSRFPLGSRVVERPGRGEEESQMGREARGSQQPGAAADNSQRGSSQMAGDTSGEAPHEGGKDQTQ